MTLSSTPGLYTERAAPVGASGPSSSVYFDKGAFSELWRSTRFSPRELQRIRRRMCSPLFSARPIVVVGQWLFTELAALRADPTLPDGARLRFHREVAFLKALPDVRVLRAPMDLLRDEVAAALSGAELDPFLPPHAIRNLDGPGWEEDWHSELRLLQEQRKHFATRERESATLITERWPDRARRTRNFETWFPGRRVEVVESWAREAMADWRQELGLPDEPSRWPAPQSLPSIWGYVSHRVARIYLLNKRGRGIDPNDLADWFHYGAAMYADQLVTTDGWLIDIAAECPPPKPAVVRFDEWAHRMLGSQAS